jgi:hypothetical protein
MPLADDRLDVIELIHRYAAVVDLKRYEDIPLVFATDAECDYGSMRAYLGDDCHPSGLDDIERWIRRYTGTRSSMHFMHNHVVELHGDVATMRNYMHNTTSSIAGVYETEARRTAHGWRLTRLHLEETFLDAERVLPTPLSVLHTEGDAPDA